MEGSGNSSRVKTGSQCAEFKITSGRRPISVHFISVFSFSGRSKLSHVLCSFRDGSASLVGLKRRHNTQSEAGNAKKRVTHDIFGKWKRDLDHECWTITWLDCE